MNRKNIGPWNRDCRNDFTTFAWPTAELDSKPASQSTLGTIQSQQESFQRSLIFQPFSTLSAFPRVCFAGSKLILLEIRRESTHVEGGGWGGGRVERIQHFFYCHWFMFNLCINLYQTRAWEIYILCFEMYSLDGFFFHFPPLPPPERLFSFIREISLLIIWNRFSLFTLNHVYVSAFCGFLFSVQSDGGKAGWELSNCSASVSVAAISFLCFLTVEVSQIKYRTNQRKYVPPFFSMAFEWGRYWLAERLPDIMNLKMVVSKRIYCSTCLEISTWRWTKGIYCCWGCVKNRGALAGRKQTFYRQRKLNCFWYMYIKSKPKNLLASEAAFEQYSSTTT